MNFAQARRTMVDCQVRTEGVTDPRIIAALDEVPREEFVPAARRSLAYLDKNIEIASAPTRVLMQAALLAKLLQAAELSAEDRVLHIGCGTGYGTALLARLCASVTAVESDPALAAQARQILERLAPSAQLITGPLEAGAPDKAPFDAMVLEGAVQTIPPALAAQLKHTGRLVCVYQRGPVGQAMVFVKTAGDLSGRAAFDAVLPPLPGFSLPDHFAL